MGRLTQKQQFMNYLGDILIFSHLFTVISAVKCKLRKGKRGPILTYFKAHILRETFQILLHQHLQSERYLFRDTYRPRTLHSKDHMWNKIINTTLIYNDDEFLCCFRSTRSTFLRLVALIKDNPILQGKNFRRHSKHFVAELHLLATLKFFGAEGNLGSNKRLRDNLGMGKGTVSNYVNRGVLAILSLHDQCFFWPSAQERRDISLRIEQKFTLKNCVGMIDGTHLNLNTRPECCGEEYYTRKNCYAISALLIVDDNKCIRYANVGWPGSIHDNHILLNKKIIHEPNNYLV